MNSLVGMIGSMHHDHAMTSVQYREHAEPMAYVSFSIHTASSHLFTCVSDIKKGTSK